MQSTSESLLIRLNGPSDRQADAWSMFVQLYTPLIFFWARKNGLSQHDSADLVQDVLTIVFQKLPTWKYNPEKSFRGWLRTITLNRQRELARKLRIKTFGEGDNDLGLFVDPKSAESTWEANYQRELVAAAMEVLRPEFAPATWAALTISLSTGRSTADIARESGVSRWTIYAAKSRLMKRLAVELKDLLD